MSQSASGNFSGAQTHNAESVDVANSPGTWFLALSTQGVFGEFRCEVSREANNNMVLIMRGLHLLIKGYKIES